MGGVVSAIVGGTVVANGGTVVTDLEIEDGRIISIGMARQRRGRVIDAHGRLVLPGGVDVHTHLQTEMASGLRSADDWRSGTAAAAAGGVTTVVDYVRQAVGESLLGTVDRWKEAARPKTLIDHAFHVVPSAFDRSTLRQLPGVVAAGYPTVKIFMSRVERDDMRAAMVALAHSGGMAMVHCEDPMIRDAATARLRREGPVGARAWAAARPRESEIAAVADAIALCAETGCPSYLVHLSCQESVAAVRFAKGRGLPVWAETRPCYLLLTDERYEDPAPLHLMFTGYPPLRRQRDVDALWEGLADRTIDAIGSDHLSWTLQQKEMGDQDIALLPVGLPALETELPALFTAAVHERRIPLERFVDAMATSPAAIVGLGPRKGAITVGADADVVILDPEREHVIRSCEMHGGAGHEPLDNLVCYGWPVLTMSRGEIVVEDGEVIGEFGRGQHLLRTLDGPRRVAPGPTGGV